MAVPHKIRKPCPAFAVLYSACNRLQEPVEREKTSQAVDAYSCPCTACYSHAEPLNHGPQPDDNDMQQHQQAKSSELEWAAPAEVLHTELPDFSLLVIADELGTLS